MLSKAKITFYLALPYGIFFKFKFIEFLILQQNYNKKTNSIGQKNFWLRQFFTEVRPN